MRATNISCPRSKALRAKPAWLICLRSLKPTATRELNCKSSETKSLLEKRKAFLPRGLCGVMFTTSVWMYVVGGLPLYTKRVGSTAALKLAGTACSVGRISRVQHGSHVCSHCDDDDCAALSTIHAAQHLACSEGPTAQSQLANLGAPSSPKWVISTCYRPQRWYIPTSSPSPTVGK